MNISVTFTLVRLPARTSLMCDRRRMQRVAIDRETIASLNATFHEFLTLIKASRLVFTFQLLWWVIFRRVKPYKKLVVRIKETYGSSFALLELVTTKKVNSSFERFIEVEN